MFRTGSTTGLRGRPHSLQEIQLRQDSIQQLSFQLHDNDAMLVDDNDDYEEPIGVAILSTVRKAARLAV